MTPCAVKQRRPCPHRAIVSQARSRLSGTCGQLSRRRRPSKMPRGDWVSVARSVTHLHATESSPAESFAPVGGCWFPQRRLTASLAPNPTKLSPVSRQDTTPEPVPRLSSSGVVQGETNAQHGLSRAVGQLPLDRPCPPSTGATTTNRRTVHRAPSGARYVAGRDLPSCGPPADSRIAESD